MKPERNEPQDVDENDQENGGGSSAGTAKQPKTGTGAKLREKLTAAKKPSRRVGRIKR
jgi:hypothetical protein